MRLPRQVYALQHNVTKKMYIGSSADPENRYCGHIGQLRKHKHPVEDLQDDYDKYGEDFSLFILDDINVISESHKETDWMKKYNTLERGKGYNYKDRHAKVGLRVTVPLKGGLPDDVTDNGEKDRLYELIEGLEVGQRAYAYSLLSKVFGKKR